MLPAPRSTPANALLALPDSTSTLESVLSVLILTAKTAPTTTSTASSASPATLQSMVSARPAPRTAMSAILLVPTTATPAHVLSVSLGSDLTPAPNACSAALSACQLTSLPVCHALLVLSWAALQLVFCAPLDVPHALAQLPA